MTIEGVLTKIFVLNRNAYVTDPSQPAKLAVSIFMTQIALFGANNWM